MTSTRYERRQRPDRSHQANARVDEAAPDRRSLQVRFVELLPDDGAEYDEEDEIDLSGLEPLIACPTSPGNVVPVREVAGRPIGQAYIGSSANPALRDLAVPALMVDGRRVDPDRQRRSEKKADDHK